MAITLHTAGEWAATTLESLAIPLPTHSTGDMLIIRLGGKVYNNTFSLNNGWTAVGTAVTSGTLAGGAGSGSTRAQAWYKEAASASETNPTLTVGGGANSTPTMYQASSYSKDSAETWVTPVGDGGVDNANNASISATVNSHVAALGGDLIDFFYVTHDNNTNTVPTITQTGITFDTVAESPATSLTTTVGNDGSADGGYRLALSGSSSAAAVVTGTLNEAEIDKSAWTTRLRVEGGTRTLFPDPATIPILTAAPVVYQDTFLTPSAVAIPILTTTPAVTVDRILLPTPVTIPILTAAPVVTIDLYITPDVVAIPIVPTIQFMAFAGRNDARVTESAVEVIYQADGAARATLTAAEVIYQAEASLRVTELATEVIYQSDAQLRVTEVAVEVIYLPAGRARRADVKVLE